MSQFDPLDYRGNSIFRNQPNYTFFNINFEEEQDSLFRVLHHIDAHFLEPEQQAESINLFNIVKDPRTQKPISQLYYDCNKQEEIKLFHSPKKSIMTEKQHELGVRVLNSLQAQLEVEEEDMYNWLRLQKLRLKEADCFQKFVYDFNQSIKEQMYAPCRKLLGLYQKWYKSKVSRLMKRYPPEAYNTHLGLPQVRQCKNVLSDLKVEIVSQEILSRIGQQCCWQDNIKEQLKRFNYTIDSYADIYENSEDLKDSLEDNLQQQFQKFAEQEVDESPKFYVPLESLLFLLTAGDYIDLSTEMLLVIKVAENLECAEKKYIVMDLPLPARQCGWHTYKQVVENATLSLLSIEKAKHDEELIFETKTDLSNPIDFKLVTLQEFMENSKSTPDKLCKFSKTLAKWVLSTSENDEHIQLYTSFDDFLSNKSVSLKLEHKPKFGCEILTKYELLKEWFKNKMSGTAKSNCLRLDVTNFQTLLEESLYTHQLEDRLSSIYHINCSEMLNNLYEFLKMLCNMLPGQYMLRYNPKFKDKLMLCRPSQELTQNTIHLHQLLNTDVTDIQFMSENNFLPIDENLCSLMHLQHKILPAAFSPYVKGRNIMYINHAYQSKRLVQPKEKREYKKKPISKERSAKKRRNRRLKLEAREAENNDLKEIEKEIELDRKMLNF